MTDEPAVTLAWTEQVRATYDEVAAPLWQAILGWSARAEVADEAVAEAFAQLLRRGHEVRDPAAWVWRAAFRLAAGDLQARRRASADHLGGSDGQRAMDRIGVERASTHDDLLDLMAPLAGLSDQQRGCVVLVDLLGHTAPSAAQILGTTAGTVRVQLMRARRHLRQHLAEASPNTEAGPEERS